MTYIIIVFTCSLNPGSTEVDPGMGLKAVDLFNNFLWMSMDLLVVETNKYAAINLDHTSRACPWNDINIDDLYVCWSPWEFKDCLSWIAIGV